MRDDPASVYGEVLAELRSSDLCIVNLECPLTRCGAAIEKSGSVLKGEPEHIKALTCVPFDIATLANNHVFDYGVDGFEETHALLKANQILSVGAGLTREAALSPLVATLGANRIAIINFSEGEDLWGAKDGPGVFGWEIKTAADLVRKSKERADLVVVICHAGVEYIPFPPPYLVKALHEIAGAGADLIVGHHPHVPQGLEIKGRTPIVYSLGNFVFYQPTDLLFRKIGCLLKVGVADGRLTHIRLIPYEIGDQGLTLLKGERLTWFWDKMNQISTPLETPAGVDDAWNAFLRYYGSRGFLDEIDMLVSHFQANPRKGAAMVRNRLTTRQHQAHWIDAMTRIIEGSIDASSEEAYYLVREWFTAKLSD